MPRDVPANETDASGERETSSRATAMPGYRCPPVPPPAITILKGSGVLSVTPGPSDAVITKKTPHPETPGFFPHALGDACCDTLRRIPIPSRLISNDEPPALTKGSGMPLVGIRPSTTLMFSNACTATIVVSPRARNAETVGRSQRNPQTAPGDDAETQQNGGRAHKAELLGDHRIDEVGVRFGQIEELLHAVHQPFAPHAARADRDERLDHLKTVSERVVPGIGKRERAAAPVRRSHHDDIDDRAAASAAPGCSGSSAPREDHGGGNQQERHRSAEVRLEEDEPHQTDDDNADGQQRYQTSSIRGMRRSSSAAMKKIALSLASSEGCTPIPPRPNHRLAPFTGGLKRTATRPSVTNANDDQMNTGSL